MHKSRAQNVRPTETGEQRKQSYINDQRCQKFQRCTIHFQQWLVSILACSSSALLRTVTVSNRVGQYSLKLISDQPYVAPMPPGTASRLQTGTFCISILVKVDRNRHSVVSLFRETKIQVSTTTVQLYAQNRVSKKMNFSFKSGVFLVSVMT